MARSKRSQSQHDSKVKELAREYESKGLDVQADVTGYTRPQTIEGVRPDLVVRKGKQRTIIEVETPDSVNSARDQRQQQSFRDAARRLQP